MCISSLFLVACLRALHRFTGKQGSFHSVTHHSMWNSLTGRVCHSQALCACTRWQKQIRLPIQLGSLHSLSWEKSFPLHDASFYVTESLHIISDKSACFWEWNWPGVMLYHCWFMLLSGFAEQPAFFLLRLSALTHLWTKKWRHF